MIKYLLSTSMVWMTIQKVFCIEEFCHCGLNLIGEWQFIWILCQPFWLLYWHSLWVLWIISRMHSKVSCVAVIVITIFYINLHVLITTYDFLVVSILIVHPMWCQVHPKPWIFLVRCVWMPHIAFWVEGIKLSLLFHFSNHFFEKYAFSAMRNAIALTLWSQPAFPKHWTSVLILFGTQNCTTIFTLCRSSPFIRYELDHPS